ncbi:FAD-dependent oxidoreductase [Nocardiopsis sediminis]|uniref:FAD-dependent oxidoreductase n=1 Tax=Nocardiopsis sediminis TaxID=1778267 RepID=A0ABV8FSA8_9ACTN
MAIVESGLSAALAGQGVDVRLGVTPVRVVRGADGIASVVLDDGTAFAAEALLVSTGRRPNTGELGLEAVGLDPAAGVTVDDTMIVVDEGRGVLVGATFVGQDVAELVHAATPPWDGRSAVSPAGRP